MKESNNIVVVHGDDGIRVAAAGTVVVVLHSIFQMASRARGRKVCDLCSATKSTLWRYNGAFLVCDSCYTILQISKRKEKQRSAAAKRKAQQASVARTSQALEQVAANGNSHQYRVDGGVDGGGGSGGGGGRRNNNINNPSAPPSPSRPATKKKAPAAALVSKRKKRGRGDQAVEMGGNGKKGNGNGHAARTCLLYTSPSPRDRG